MKPFSFVSMNSPLKPTKEKNHVSNKKKEKYFPDPYKEVSQQ